MRHFQVSLQKNTTSLQQSVIDRRESGIYFHLMTSLKKKTKNIVSGEPLCCFRSKYSAEQVSGRKKFYAARLDYSLFGRISIHVTVK